LGGTTIILQQTEVDGAAGGCAITTAIAIEIEPIGADRSAIKTGAVGAVCAVGNDRVLQDVRAQRYCTECVFCGVQTT
jgi:hypothetical protein